MGAPAWEDLSEFFDAHDPGGFAVAAQVWRGEECIAGICGIVDDPNEVLNLGGDRENYRADYDLDQTSPSFLCADPAVLEVCRGDILVTDGARYDILEAPQSDGTGVARLVLATPLIEC